MWTILCNFKYTCCHQAENNSAHFEKRKTGKKVNDVNLFHSNFSKEYGSFNRLIASISTSQPKTTIIQSLYWLF